MNVDLDRYREPSRDPAVLAARREALLHQLGWLADEAEALGGALDGLPGWALEQTALPDERSVKATLAHLAALDRDVYARWVERVVAEDAPGLDDLEAEDDPAANERALDDLLAEVRRRRAALIEAVGAVPEADWDRTATLGGEARSLYDLVLHIVRYDAEALRTLAYRLHEARLSDRA